MNKHTIDTVLQLRVRHRPGNLARIAQAIANEGGLIGEVRTLSMGEEVVVREVTIETDDDRHTERVVGAVRKLQEVELQSVTDAVFEFHKGGKLQQKSKLQLTQIRDLRKIYTPGVARVANAIVADPEVAWELTGIGNSVGIFTNGTRVLGLGDIGNVAALPVMEGKAVLYEQLAGISATPILVDTKDPQTFIETVVRIAPTFGGIHLEDIRSPDCYVIEEELRRRLKKPVMHDDQHGTATVALAAAMNAANLAGLDLRNVRVGQLGLGAAGSAIAKLIHAYGVKEMLVFDPSEAAVARVMGPGFRSLSLEALLREADIVIATTGRAGLISPSMVRPGQVILALSNPEPEIAPADALNAGAKFAADGRSINNALAFPGLFRGALLARTRTISTEMMLEAARVIALQASPGDLVPNPLDRSIHVRVAEAVRAKAESLGLANTIRLSG
ncbi:MAG: NAD-dependent malic enzyme [Polyangiaceae bacterium]|nr:NAD-dependent malic enzyme [Polyangiaceae bacterium]